LTIGNGDNGGGVFWGSIANGSGIMALAKVGAGTITLAGTNIYTGATIVSGGTLQVTGVISNGPVSVSSGATLGGNGSIVGPVTISAGGTLSPGTGIGTMTFAGSLALSGNLAVEINKLLTPSNDLCVVNGVLTNGGTGLITVTNLGPACAAGDSFKLFSQPVLNGDALTITPAPGANLAWVNQLAFDGTIRVASTVPTNITVLAAANNLLTLSWPADHTGWRLQMQTNDLASTNWVDVEGSVNTNQIFFPVESASNAFFRLTYP
jgi:autotransporter-associated beta strand protein